jgi:hypothetical protein
VDSVHNSKEVDRVHIHESPIGDELHHGCPLNNVAQEMSAIDPGFKERTQRVFGEWIAAFRAALEDGKRRGVVRPEVDAGDTAILLTTLIEGILSLAKNSQDPEVLRAGARNIRTVLSTLSCAR